MSVATASPEVRPAAPTVQRLPALDLLRGLAILAILPANMPFFSGGVNQLNLQENPASTLDQAVLAGSLVLVFGKFVTLLAILFGAGLALQLEHARTEGRPFALGYVRRMAVLFLIGLAHGLFLWFGDILSSYAIVALGALLLSPLSQRGLLRASAAGLGLACGGLLVSATVLITTGPGLSIAINGTDGGSAVEPLLRWWQHYASTENQVAIYRDGSVGAMVLNRAVCLVGTIASFWSGAAWYLLACFLIGVYLLRRGVFHDLDEQRPFIRRLIFIGLLLGVPLQLVAAILYLVCPANGLYLVLPYSIGALPLALAYLGLILLWSRSGVGVRVQHGLQAVGRTALTNYLLQSVLCNLIFYSYGLKLYGELGHAAALGVVLLIWLAELLGSVWWLRSFQMGPVEWLWRSLAEGKSRPLRNDT